MLAIRMQRTGRKGHAMFRVVVQDARRTPTSGKIVARLGSYDPHAKTVTLDKEKASFYLEHGAQPSDRAAILLKKEGVKLPEWVQVPDKKEGTVRNPEKRRSTRPEEPAEEAPKAVEPSAEEQAPETEEAPAEPASEAEVPAENTEPEKPAEAEAKEAEEKTDDAKSEEKPDEAPAENKPADSEEKADKE